MTGTWLGYYKYDNELHQKTIGFDKTNFTIIIQSFDGKNFKGIVNDDITTGGMKETGDIVGSVEGEKLSFQKFMPRETLFNPNGERITSDKKHRTLYYSGILSNDKKEITGQWKFKIKIGFLFGLIPIPYRGGKGTWSMKLQ